MGNPEWAFAEWRDHSDPWYRRWWRWWITILFQGAADGSEPGERL